MSALFWSLFGDVGPGAFETKPAYESIEFGGQILFGIYNVIAVVVILNMLIAVLNDAYIRSTVSSRTLCHAISLDQLLKGP